MKSTLFLDLKNIITFNVPVASDPDSKLYQIMAKIINFQIQGVPINMGIQ